ncbi:MAG: 5-formyltetrahydrofolate cyclo-ligase [Campylobacterota bacterium]|nr:5-formyltetrahydrofolate cyclo-ligase [Campylobacterota bacterium]
MIDKTDFRKQSLTHLRKISKQGAYRKDKYIVSALYEKIKSNNVNSVLLYIALSMEVNLMPLIVQLRKEGKRIYVPFMEGKSFRVVRYRLPLFKKQFGIKEPNNSKQYKKKQIDLAIVPIVGTDKTFRRVGFGKGMYDRYFEKEYKNTKEVIFVARALCYSKEVLTNHYDVRADSIITP